MYTQPLFEIREADEIRRFVRSHPLATLVTADTGGWQANLLPLECVDRPEGAGFGLRGHVGRAHALASSPAAGTGVMVVFQSANAYVSPRWYVNGQRSRRVAPSWNYAAVEVHGVLRLVDDAAWMTRHLTALTASQEAHRPQPWSPDEAADGFVEEAARRLVGFEIAVTRASGRRFLSQQRTEADRESLVRQLLQEPRGAARDVAGLILEAARGADGDGVLR